MNRFVLALIIPVILVLGCTTGGDVSSPESAPAATATPVDTYVWPETPLQTKTGIRYVILKEGAGPLPQAGQTVTMHYTGWLYGGKKFESSRDQNAPVAFVMGAGQVIRGLEEGIAMMRVGEKRTLIIPPALAYGPNGKMGVIPRKATLIYNIELLGAQ